MRWTRSKSFGHLFTEWDDDTRYEITKSEPDTALYYHRNRDEIGSERLASFLNRPDGSQIADLKRVAAKHRKVLRTPILRGVASLGIEGVVDLWNATAPRKPEP